MQRELDETMKFKIENLEEAKLVNIMQEVYTALEEKGYDPASQIIGYIISGDPTYITSYKDARKKIKQIDRNDILEDILEFYFVKNNIK